MATTNKSVTCQADSCSRPIELSDASSLLWKLKNIYYASTAVAEDSTQYWADIATTSKSKFAPMANVPGVFAALWTPGVAPSTALTLGTAGFSFINVPKTLTHFTTVAGATGIRQSGVINASRNMLNNALFGPGVYLAKIGRPMNLLISKKSLLPIVISTPAGTARIIPYLVYVRWGVAPVAVNILNK
jgi:hypothetical protein